MGGRTRARRQDHGMDFQPASPPRIIRLKATGPTRSERTLFPPPGSVSHKPDAEVAGFVAAGHRRPDVKDPLRGRLTRNPVFGVEGLKQGKNL